MLGMKQRWLRRIATLVCSCTLLAAASADETPKETLQNAIKAHGGKKNLAKTLTGTIVAKVKLSLSPDKKASVTWEETFELPRRSRRSIKGQFTGQEFSMEYAITDGSGWIRRNGGEEEELKVKKLPLSRSWNATLALLPACLEDGTKLEPGGKDKVEGREVVGVRVSGEALGGEAVLFFDSKSGLLVKSKKRMQHPLSGQEVDGEVVYSVYKEVSGVQYPHRITASIEGKKVMEMEITEIKLLNKIEDRLFEKP